MALPKKVILCAYCGVNHAETEDHVPSKGLFPDPKAFTIFRIPACLKCNNGFSLDEEFFRNFACNLGTETSKSANVLLQTKITRAAKRNPSLAKKLFERMSLVDLYTPGGIYIGKKTKVEIKPEDHVRIQNIIIKYAKGLFFQNFQIPLPLNHKIRITWLTEKNAKLVPQIINEIKPIAKFSDIFAYGYNKVPDSYNSIWLINFYNKLPFLIFITDDLFQKTYGH